MKQYENNKPLEGLDHLLCQNNAANAYFQSLPEYVQEMIMQRRQNIHTEEELRSYSDNITQGDK